MEGYIYIPYVNTDLDDEKFNYNGNSFDYISKLNEVENSIVGADYYFTNKPTNNSFRFNANINNMDNNDQILYYEIKCEFLNPDETPMKIDNLLNNFKNGESFMLIFSFDYENTEEDVLIELKSWISESKKVMEMPDDVYSEDIKIGLLPKRRFKIKIGKGNAYLNECLYFDNSNDKVTIFVNNIIFYN